MHSHTLGQQGRDGVFNIGHKTTSCARSFANKGKSKCMCGRTSGSLIRIRECVWYHQSVSA